MTELAAQTTSALNAYSVGTNAGLTAERSCDGRRGGLGQCSGDLAPLRSPAGAISPESGRQAGVAIIPVMDWEGLSDEALISGYQSETGSQAEQYANELFRRHHVKIARWCWSFTNDRESAADLAQEICAKAYQNLGNFKGQSKFTTWLFSIARNHCLNAVRSRASQPAMQPEEEVVETLPDLGQNPEKSAEHNQMAQIARQLMNDTLDEIEKAVFTLHFSEEMPLDAITRVLKLENASGAKAYIVSAKRKLDRAVKRWKARSEGNSAVEEGNDN
jgi:RNA polymerase sigma-70 factor (ECF subfamily)